MSVRTPLLPTDDAARKLARSLIAGARFGALGVLDPETGDPFVSRVAVGADAAGQPLTLVSELSAHTAALRANSACSLLLGEPGPKGDPLTYPRITLQARAHFVPRSTADHAALREDYLLSHPKAQLYVDFADFSFVRLVPHRALLNGGFGKAYGLSAADFA
ncbi:putative heme iron utilization protein [Rhodovulum iodosum]|uniref:Heme iron utilization protein n=1 Tax=Rhodovulum iodosum TaxID=68291 RepID=A0ABV3XWY2_9RHOB|nr:pyridoxamine 5'-phosphate oxidase family protein [Rhodovulum robiginosum]RSK34078.1 HugZ family protein [Rhodovulum robiginosum]